MEKISLIKEKSLFLRFDVLSFVITYLGLAPTLYYLDLVDFIYLKFFFILLFFFNCLFFLICESYDNYKSMARFVETT